MEDFDEYTPDKSELTDKINKVIVHIEYERLFAAHYGNIQKEQEYDAKRIKAEEIREILEKEIVTSTEINLANDFINENMKEIIAKEKAKKKKTIIILVIVGICCLIEQICKIK